jgi:S1-C subfamily serine protease
MQHQTPSALRALFSWALTCAVLLAAPALHAATLEPAVLPRVQAATFEVVIPKPASDPLTYEKPLPLDQLPFQERKDKYDSVGTAFALDGQHYVTAGHVLALGIGHLAGEPALRDAEGKVYAIDQITRFSAQQDFVEFTLKNPPAIAPLEVNADPAMNDVVYAVGNALGSGIVIRDGLYTSQTPEDEDGRWKWLRFSAAASPGNSGGPLLDKNGKLIGVVLMKSPGENLNYALPIDLVVKAPANLADIDKRWTYDLDVIEDKHSDRFKAQFALPKSFADFAAAYQKLDDENTDRLLQELLAENAATLFPRGEGASRVLHTESDANPFPSLLHRGDNGIWSVVSLRAGKNVLPLNGYVSSTGWGSQMLFHLRKPDDVSSAQLYGDAKLLMDLLLKAMPMRRQVGAEAIKVTSLGQPTKEETLTDAWQRPWQIKVWPLPHQNIKVIVFLLPVPDGYAGMIRRASPPSERGHMDDLKTLANFVHLSYTGTLAQWQEYLATPALLPAALHDVTLRFDYGKEFAYRSKRLEFSYAPTLQAIDKNSQLTLGMSWFDDHGKVVWDVSSINARPEASNAGGIYIARHVAPSDDLDDSYRSEWAKMLRRGHPYGGAPYSKNDMTFISTVGAAPAAANAKPGVLYEISWSAEGPRPVNAMKEKLGLLLSTLKVNER